MKVKKYIIGGFGIILFIVLLFTLASPISVKQDNGNRVQAQTTECDINDTANWCQVQRDPQRTGYTPEVLGTNVSVVWRKAFQPEKIYPQVQAIVYQNKVYVGTEHGNMYSLNTINGSQAWKYTVGSPILASVAAYNNRIYFGAMDGAVYAINVNTGILAWKKQLSVDRGFSTSPVIVDNKIMLGGRNGIFYAVDPVNGNVIWQYDVGRPIYQSAAYNNGKVFFGTMDMYVYALNSADGSLAWKSQKIPGMAFKDYWPTVAQNKIIVRPVTATTAAGIRPGFPFQWNLDPTWLSTNGPTIAAGNLTQVADAVNAQNTVMSSYQANPSNFTKNLFIFEETTGQDNLAVPHFMNQTMNGTTSPPCIDKEGKLIVPLFFNRSGWGRLDLTTQRIVDILYDGTMLGFANQDETTTVTCTNNLILSFHGNEENGVHAGYQGAFDLNNRRWFTISPGQSSQQMSTITMGGGANPVSVASGMIYHISWHELIARRTQ